MSCMKLIDKLLAPVFGYKDLSAISDHQLPIDQSDNTEVVPTGPQLLQL